MLYLHNFETWVSKLVSWLWQEKSDAYDKLERELAMERRAQPSSRTKTPEEIAQEEREQLERLEVSHSFICLLECKFHLQIQQPYLYRCLLLLDYSSFTHQT